MRRKLMIAVMSGILALSIAGCATNERCEQNLPTEQTEATLQMDGLPEEAAPEEAEVIYEPPALRSELAEAEMVWNEGITIEYEEIQMREIPINEGTEFASKLQAGWNLGNTFDAFIDDSMISGAGLSCENAWVGISTSEAMIDAIKSAGFSSIRIPVSWHNHLDKDGRIMDRWIDRVREVVDYAISADMYVILNIHHDNDKNYNHYFYPDAKHKEQSIEYIENIWNQVASKFRNYDEHLIFESLNEPRLIGTSYEWYIADVPQCTEACEIISELNQVFVDTVRKSGGNNATRFLLIPGYDASVDGALRPEFVLPKDTIENHIMVETHAYSPYNFALQDGGINTFGDTEKKFLDEMFDSLYEKFISQGIPVVMDEFGARDKDNLQDRVNFTAYYIAKAKSVGIPCFWWDNNNFTGDGERFGLLGRASLEIRYPEIAEAMVKQYEGNGEE